jgi:hypothetical protein
MSEFTDMLKADRDEIFLNLEEFGETITHAPYGGQETPITAIVVEDKLIGTNEVDGDGVTPESRQGARIRNSSQLALSADIAVDDRDWFVIRGQRVALRRPLSSDGVMRILLIDYVQPIDTRRPRGRFSH